MHLWRRFHQLIKYEVRSARLELVRWISSLLLPSRTYGGSSQLPAPSSIKLPPSPASPDPSFGGRQTSRRAGWVIAAFRTVMLDSLFRPPCFFGFEFLWYISSQPVWNVLLSQDSVSVI